MAPLMVVKLLVEVADHAQVQVVPVMPPSGSVTFAVRGLFTVGVARDRVTAPGSSTSVTLMVRAMVSVPLEGSVAVIVTEYDGLPSKSMVALDLTVISPLEAFRLKSSLNAASSTPTTSR